MPLAKNDAVFLELTCIPSLILLETNNPAVLSPPQIAEQPFRDLIFVRGNFLKCVFDPFSPRCITAGRSAQLCEVINDAN